MENFVNIVAVAIACVALIVSILAYKDSKRVNDIQLLNNLAHFSLETNLDKMGHIKTYYKKDGVLYSYKIDDPDEEVVALESLSWEGGKITKEMYINNDGGKAYSIEIDPTIMFLVGVSKKASAGYRGPGRISTILTIKLKDFFEIMYTGRTTGTVAKMVPKNLPLTKFSKNLSRQLRGLGYDVNGGAIYEVFIKISYRTVDGEMHNPTYFVELPSKPLTLLPEGFNGFNNQSFRSHSTQYAETVSVFRSKFDELIAYINGRFKLFFERNETHK